MKEIAKLIEEIIREIGKVDDDEFDDELAMVQRLLITILNYIEEKIQ